MNFVIIGGDAAGMSAASRAKRKRPDLNVTVLEQTRDVSYSACSMPYHIADPDREMDELVVRSADEFIQRQQIDLRTGHRVSRIDRQNRLVSGHTLSGDPFQVPFDKLLIATGARPVLPEVPGRERLLPLKSLEHGRQIKSAILEKGVRKAAILGMGYIALEMCEAFSHLGIRADMIKPGPVFLPWLPGELSDVVRDELDRHHVGIHTGTMVRRIDEQGTGSRLICDNFTLDADLVLSAIGVTPASDLAEAAGLDLSVGGSISVDRYLRTTDPDIFAAGDCGDAYHVVTGQKTWIPLALRANRAGWAVADNLFRDRNALTGVAGTSVFKVFDLAVARSGLTLSEAEKAGFDPVENQIKSWSRVRWQAGAAPVFVNMVGDRKTGHLLGAQMVGKDGIAHRINAVAVALQAGFTVADFIQTDLAYAPPFGPTWDPLLTAANQLRKQL